MVKPSVLITLCRLIGLCNLRYVPERGRFQRDNGPMLIYWMSLHLLFVLLTPCIIFVMARSYLQCRGMDMLALHSSIVCLSKSCLVLLLLSRTWWQRHRWQRLGNAFLAFQQLYRRDLLKFGFSYWLRNIWKTVLSLSNFMLLIYMLVGPGSLLMCDNIHINNEVIEISTSYIFLSLVVLSMQLIVSCADYWLHYMIGTSNWIIDCLSKETQDLRKDVHWLPQRRRGCHRFVYQEQLLSGWQQLWRRYLRVDRLVLELLHICRWQILLHLLTNYLADIAIIFNMFVYMNEAYVVWIGLCLIVLCGLFHWEVMSFFSIFEEHQLQWMHLLQCMQNLWSTVSWMDIDWPEDTHCIALYRQVPKYFPFP